VGAGAVVNGGCRRELVGLGFAADCNRGTVRCGSTLS
jgi:hypothetical protein